MSSIFKQSGGWTLVAGFALLVGVSPAWGLRSADVEKEDSLRSVGGRAVWETRLPLRYVARVTNAHLVDASVLVADSDGQMRSIDAISGNLLWRRAFMVSRAHLERPMTYRAPWAEGIVLPLLDRVYFADAVTAEPLSWASPTRLNENNEPVIEKLDVVPFESIILRSVAPMPTRLFVAQPGGWLRGFPLVGDGHDVSHIRLSSRLALDPVPAPETGLVAAADETGRLLVIDGSRGTLLYEVQLRGMPIGHMRVIGDRLYIVTMEPTLFEIELLSGSISLEYRLPARPTGGPEVTEESIYIPTQKGVQRIGLKPEWRNWLAGDAQRFVAEWPEYVVLQQASGALEYVQRRPSRRYAPGDTRAVVPLSGDFRALSNPFNDQILLVSSRGIVRCLRPIGSRPLQRIDFRYELHEPPSGASPEAEDGFVTHGKPVGEPREGNETDGGSEETAERQPRLTPLEQIIADPLRSRYHDRTDMP